MNLGDWSNLFTVVGFPLGLAGIGLVLFQMRADKLSGSAGTMATMHENIRTRVEVLSQIEPTIDGNENPEWTGAFRDLLNDLEVACAAYLDSQFSGRTGRLAEFLIRDMLKILQYNASLHPHLEKAIHDPETFVNIRDFLAKKN